jgi:hypothetical protein
MHVAKGELRYADTLVTLIFSTSFPNCADVFIRKEQKLSMYKMDSTVYH